MNSAEQKNIENWISLILSANEELRKLNSISESEFLETGEYLRKFYNKSKDISGFSLQISELLSGNDITETIKNLKLFLLNLEKYSAETDGLTENANSTLLQIRKNINDIYSPLEGFKKSVKLLNILGISIRIEDASLNSDNKEFNILAEEVTKLSEVIRSKLDVTFKLTIQLDKMIEDTLKKVNKLIIERNSNKDEIIKKVDEGLLHLIEKKQESAQIAEMIPVKSEIISKQAGKIVTAIQFHDITRQQIEHIQSAYMELADGYHDLEDANQEKMVESASVINEMMRLQLNQLFQTRESIRKATSEIKNGLSSLQKDVTDFISFSQSITGITGDQSSTVLTEIQQKIKTVNLSLKENLQTNKELVDAVSSSADTIEKISSLLNDIKMAGLEIELISLNAIVKTAKLGSRGAALSVLASSIRGLSIDTAEQIKNIDETILGITEISQSLRKGVSNETEKNTKELDEMTLVLEGLTGKAEDVNSSIKILNQNLNSEVKQLSTEISKLLGNLRIEELFNYSLNAVEEIMKEVISQTAKNANLKLIGENRPLNFLEKNYSMKSERDIHKSFYTKNGNSVNYKEHINDNDIESNESNIEFF